jgi:hypothetical protein
VGVCVVFPLLIPPCVSFCLLSFPFPLQTQGGIRRGNTTHTPTRHTSNLTQSQTYPHTPSQHPNNNYSTKALATSIHTTPTQSNSHTTQTISSNTSTHPTFSVTPTNLSHHSTLSQTGPLQSPQTQNSETSHRTSETSHKQLTTTTPTHPTHPTQNS